MRSPRVSAAKSRSLVAGLTDKALWSAAGGALFFTLIGWGARFSWVLALFEHFRVQLAAGALLVAIGAAVAKRLGPAALAGLAVVVNLAVVLPVYLAGESATHHSAPLGLLVLNVQQDNADHARVARYLAASDADVIGLLEVDSAWLRDLAPTLARYPYRLPQPHDKDKFGLALYSRRPFLFREVRTFGVPWPPSIVARIDVDGVPVTFVLAHPPPALRGETAAIQRGFFEALAEKRSSLGEHLVVMGDLNATPWSYALRHLLDRTGLRDSRRGFGLQPSWPAANPFLRLPIDHLLVSPRIAVLARAIGPAVGSDHFPLLATIAYVR